MGRILRWLVPTVLGPFLAVWTLATVQVLLGHYDAKFGKWGSWELSMLVGSVVAGALVVLLVGTDLLRVKLARRELPCGWRAWLGSALAPLLVFGLWTLWRPGELDGGLLVLRLATPLLASVAAVRLVLGPGRS